MGLGRRYFSRQRGTGNEFAGHYLSSLEGGQS